MREVKSISKRYTSECSSKQMLIRLRQEMALDDDELDLSRPQTDDEVDEELEDALDSLAIDEAVEG
jgi:hypothetical protein